VSFLAPIWIPLLTAGLAVPVLLLLYFLKLRRQEMAVSSTLLWRQTIQDLQVNAPFQRLKNSLLLWLQMATLLTAVFCLWQPVVRRIRAEEKTSILLIDQSASMATRESGGQTRLEMAKAQAKTYIDNLDNRSKVMIIAHSDRAHVVCPFTTDKAALRLHIDSLSQTDGPSRLGEALQLAEAHGTRQVLSTGAGDLTPESATESAEMVLFSDGRIEDASALVLRRGSLSLACIGQGTDNAGILSLDVRRNYERPEVLSVFATVANYGPNAIESDVTVKVDGRLLGVGPVRLAGVPKGAVTTNPSADAGGSPSTAGVPFEMPFAGSGVLEVSLVRPDALPADNTAWAVVQPPRSLDVLLVSSDNPFLKKALGSLPLRRLLQIAPQAFESDSGKYATEGRLAFDVAVLDRHSPGRLPVGNYIFFGALPKVDEIKGKGDVTGEFIYDWDEQHPILRHVLLSHLRVSKWQRVELPPRAVRLVEGETTPVIALLSSGGSRFLLVAFDLFDSNWPLQVGFPIFAYNAIQYLSGNTTTGTSEVLRPGQALPIAVPPGVDRLTVRRPDGRRDSIETKDRPIVYYGDTYRLGLYRVEPSAPGHEGFAVNLLNATESDIRPNPGLKIGTEAITTAGVIRHENRPLWPWLLLGAMALLLVEWTVYNRRMRV